MAGLVWRTPPMEAWPKGGEAYVRSVRAGIHGVCLRWAPEIENYMKSNAPWTDRTSNARQALHAKVEPPTPAAVVAEIELIMAHGMIYGSFLEGYDWRRGYTRTQQGDRFAIIEPTLDLYAPRVWADIRRLFS